MGIIGIKQTFLRIIGIIKHFLAKKGIKKRPRSEKKRGKIFKFSQNPTKRPKLANEPTPEYSRREPRAIKRTGHDHVVW